MFPSMFKYPVRIRSSLSLADLDDPVKQAKACKEVMCSHRAMATFPRSNDVGQSGAGLAMDQLHIHHLA